MDTRTKIVSATEAARIAAAGATVVTGYFDPLLASHAERLQQLKRDGVPLLVAIANPENPILPSRARAELVAGLAVVDHVTEFAAELDLSVSLHPAVNLQEAHGREFQELIQLVHGRQQRAAP